jgi:hypothetical protein
MVKMSGKAFWATVAAGQYNDGLEDDYDRIMLT